MSTACGNTIAIPSIKYRGKVTSIVDTTTLILSAPLPSDVTNISTTITNEVSVRALEVGVDSGVWFTNGLFVANYVNSIVPDTSTGGRQEYLMSSWRHLRSLRREQSMA